MLNYLWVIKARPLETHATDSISLTDDFYFNLGPSLLAIGKRW